MKNIVLPVALGLCLAGCAEVAPRDDANAGTVIFQADTAQAPDHIFQCVNDAYRGQSGVNAFDLPGGGKKIVATLANGAVVEVVRFVPTATGAHVDVHQITTERRDPFGFVKQARVCGAMSGS